MAQSAAETSSSTHELRFPQSLSHHAPAGLRAQRGVHLASAGGAGRPAHAVEGRQRGGCGHRRRRRHDHLEPVSNGLGSDAFAILWDGKELHGLNASGRAPAAWTPEYFKQQVRRRRQDAAQARHRFASPCRAPWRSWVALSERFGKLPFADLLEPAIEIAERGYLLPHGGAAEVGRGHAGAAASMPGFAQSLPALGPRARRSASCSSSRPRRAALRAIAETKGEAFYGGEIAAGDREASRRRTAAASRRKDFAALQARVGQADRPRTTAATRCTRSRPTGQGIAALIALGILEKFDLRRHAGGRRRTRSTCRSRR